MVAAAADSGRRYCGLGFKFLMHRLSGQRWQGCGRGGYDLSDGEQGPGRSTDSSSGPAEAPASAPGGAQSSAPCATFAARGKSRNSPSRSPPPPPAPPRISSIPTCPGFRTSPGERHDWIKYSPALGPLLRHSQDESKSQTFNQQLCTECLLHARHWAECGDTVLKSTGSLHLSRVIISSRAGTVKRRQLDY